MFESVISLVTAAFLLFGSPGPAPLALAATGSTFGDSQLSGSAESSRTGAAIHLQAYGCISPPA